MLLVLQAVTNFATTANGVLASTFLLYSVGLGAGAIPTAGALNWVLKDGLGQMGTLLFGKAIAHNFDIHSKTWYFMSFLLLSTATGAARCCRSPQECSSTLCSRTAGLCDIHLQGLCVTSCGVLVLVHWATVGSMQAALALCHCLHTLLHACFYFCRLLVPSAVCGCLGALHNTCQS